MGGLAAPGRFPMGFTATHDLATDYLVKKSASLQSRDVEIVQKVVDELAESPRLQALAEDVLGQAKQHLADLESLAGDATPT